MAQRPALAAAPGAEQIDSTTLRRASKTAPLDVQKEHGALAYPIDGDAQVAPSNIAELRKENNIC